MMQLYKGEDLPTLLDNQYSVIHVDMRTGKILDAEGKRPCEVTKEDWVLIFESLGEAEAYASEKVAHQGGLQCSIFDSQAQWVKARYKIRKTRQVLVQRPTVGGGSSGRSDGVADPSPPYRVITMYPQK